MSQASILMKYAPFPDVSNTQINNAGKILSGRKPGNTTEFSQAINIVYSWRAAHAYPINTFQATLRTKLKTKDFKDYIVAQRLKRLPTIIDKLRRHPNMQLSTMQDIGGLRAILKSNTDVYRLHQQYCNNAYFQEMITKTYDYIENPRDIDGYRSLHLVFVYKNIQNPSYDGLKLEMQIRTKLQHTWATAVETMGTFLGQALKSRQGEKKWIDFFALVSSAFAYIEKSKPVPRFSILSRKETFIKVVELERELDVLNRMISFSAAMDIIIQKNEKGTSFYLIILDSLNHKLDIRRYDRYSFEKASKEYSEIESAVIQGKKVEAVLVSAGKIDSLRKAYPNFYLDTTEFTKAIVSIMREAGH